MSGRIYVHCMAGHGRSAAVVAGLLLARGLVSDTEAAEAQLKRARPLVALTEPQRELLRTFAARAAGTVTA